MMRQKKIIIGGTDYHYHHTCVAVQKEIKLARVTNNCVNYSTYEGNANKLKSETKKFN